MVRWLWMALLAALGAISGRAAMADVVVDWNELANVTSESEDMAQGAPSSTWTPKEEAEEIVAVAIFQAVNTVSPRYRPFREALPSPTLGASVSAAAAAAGHAALVAIFPERKARLDEAFELALASIADSPARRAGIAVGERAAQQVIGWRTVDNSAAPLPYRPNAPPGKWVPTTPTTIAPYFWSSRPWLMSSLSQFRPPPPESLNGETWARDYNEVRSLGARQSASRPAEWTPLATFYSGWRHEPLIRQVASLPGRTLEQNARLYAMVAMAVADAQAAMADGKLFYEFWRPITAIRNGDEDGNDATERQADWEPLLKTPMHPEYPCGHCVAIAALTTVLAAEAPAPTGGIAVTSDAMPGVVRYVASWSTLSEEISVSRIYAGAHFRNSVEVGQALGNRVAAFALRGFLVPVH